MRCHLSLGLRIAQPIPLRSRGSFPWRSGGNDHPGQLSGHLTGTRWVRPRPVHGLAKAQRLEQSPVPPLTLLMPRVLGPTLETLHLSSGPHGRYDYVEPEGMTQTQLPPRVLIVEDDSTLASLMASVLEEAGYTSEIVTSPDAAEGRYDLVVADYLAPVYVPGQPWPFVDRLRDLCQGGPILGCTGHQDALNDSPTVLGITAVTAKPFDVDELLTLVERLLEQGKALANESPVRAESVTLDPAA